MAVGTKPKSQSPRKSTKQNQSKLTTTDKITDNNVAGVINSLDYSDDQQPLVKPRGRPKSTNYLSYDQAKQVVQNELIPSRNKYLLWWDINKPALIPKYPHRQYKDWISWNDFLGNNNEFKQGRMSFGDYLPYEKALEIVHRLKLKTREEWMQWCRIAGNLPQNIPGRPDITYPQWIGWNQWLGNKPVEILAVTQQAIRQQVYYIIHQPDVPSNVLTFGVDPSLSFIKQRWINTKSDIIKLFWYDQSKQQSIDQIISNFSTPYLQENKTRIVPNVWEIVFYLEMLIDPVTAEQAAGI